MPNEETRNPPIDFGTGRQYYIYLSGRGPTAEVESEMTIIRSAPTFLRERDEARQQRDALAAALRLVEWSLLPDDEDEAMGRSGLLCPDCGEPKNNGVHASTCRVSAALALVAP